MSSEAIIRGILNVHSDDTSHVGDHDGDCPKCKNAIGTSLCERCGRDVRDNCDTACPAIPAEQRWRVKCD